MRVITLIFSMVSTLILILFFNGNISIPGKTLPPLGKILNPINGLWKNAEDPTDFQNETLTSPQIREEVKIVYDDRKVPHIFASNMEDALFAQGYVEARDRLFQLEFIYRFASGTLSEVLGPRTIQTDIMQRRKGLTWASENALEGWKSFPEDLARMESYVAGINHYLEEVTASGLPIEFKLIGIPKSPWSVLKCAHVSKWMSDVLCGRSADIQMSNLREALGTELFQFLYPDRGQRVDPVIPDEVDYAFDTLYLPEYEAPPGMIGMPSFKHDLYPESPKNVGSNNWAISREKSATGAPIFCNDPHLSLTLPSVWYEIGIHLPDKNTYGVTIPGMPGVMMGFNDYFAWGETNVGQDVKDYKKIKWIDKEKFTYLLDGKEVKATPRYEKITVKGESPKIDTVLYTYWGPVTYETIDGDNDYAMRWISHDTPDKPEFMTFLAGMVATNYDEYLQVTENFLSPAQNFAYAAKDGDIALRVNGLFPAKRDQEGRFVDDGSSTHTNWKSFIPRSQVPQVLNPSRGFISSANQRSTDNGYPYYYNGKFEYSRNRSINHLLGNGGQFGIEDMKSFQLNNKSMFAGDLLPGLISALDSTLSQPEEKEYLDKLRDWDYTYPADSETATFFELMVDELRSNTFDEIDSLRKKTNISFPEDWRIVEILEGYPNHQIFDIMETAKTENASDIITISFTRAREKFLAERSEGRDMAWGAYAPLQIMHLARIPAFSAQDLVVGGHPDALNAIGTTHGPSWRMVVSLEEQTRAYGVFPGGQSGNPLSKYYRTSLEKWKNGEYHELKIVTGAENIKNPLFSINFIKS